MEVTSEEDYINSNSDLKCKFGVLTRPDGSALFCEGGEVTVKLLHFKQNDTFKKGETAVLAAVYGPVEVKMQKVLIDKASVECFYRPKAGHPGTLIIQGVPRRFSQHIARKRNQIEIKVQKQKLRACKGASRKGVQDRFRESLIRNICGTAIAASLYPRAAILVNIQEMQNRGKLISCAINASCLACINSGIDMKFLFGAVSCFLTSKEEFSFVPPINEEKIRALFVLVFNNTTGSMLASHTEGSFSIDQYQRAVSLCREESKNVFSFFKKSLLSSDKI